MAQPRRHPIASFRAGAREDTEQTFGIFRASLSGCGGPTEPGGGEPDLPTGIYEGVGKVQYIHGDLGHLPRGAVVEVSLSGSTAMVVLMDSANFRALKTLGRAPEAYGGMWRRSPVHLTVPRSGQWHAVVYIPRGYGGSVSASFRLTREAA